VKKLFLGTEVLLNSYAYFTDHTPHYISQCKLNRGEYIMFYISMLIAVLLAKPIVSRIDSAYSELKSSSMGKDLFGE